MGQGTQQELPGLDEVIVSQAIQIYYDEDINVTYHTGPKDASGPLWAGYEVHPDSDTILWLVNDIEVALTAGPKHPIYEPATFYVDPFEITEDSGDYPLVYHPQFIRNVLDYLRKKKGATKLEVGFGLSQRDMARIRKAYTQLEVGFGYEFIDVGGPDGYGGESNTATGERSHQLVVFPLS